MTMTAIPATEADLLVLATGLSREEVEQRMGRLSELERNVLEWRAPIAGELLGDHEIARRLGLHRKDVGLIATTARAKLRHPSFGAPPAAADRAA